MLIRIAVVSACLSPIVFVLVHAEFTAWRQRRRYERRRSARGGFVTPDVHRRWRG